MENIFFLDAEEWPTLSEIKRAYLPVDAQANKMSSLRFVIEHKQQQCAEFDQLTRDWVSICFWHSDSELVTVILQQEAACRYYGHTLYQYQILLLLQMSVLSGYVQCNTFGDCMDHTQSFFGFTSLKVCTQHAALFWKDIVGRLSGKSFKRFMTCVGLRPVVHRNWDNALLGMTEIVFNATSLPLAMKTSVTRKRKRKEVNCEKTTNFIAD